MHWNIGPDSVGCPSFPVSAVSRIFAITSCDGSTSRRFVSKSDRSSWSHGLSSSNPISLIAILNILRSTFTYFCAALVTVNRVEMTHATPVWPTSPQA
jgi:hypothetical protein